MAKKKGGKKKGGAQRTKAERKADVREKLLTSREGEEPAPHDASSTPIVAPAILASPRRELGDHRRSGHPWPPLLPEGASPPPTPPSAILAPPPVPEPCEAPAPARPRPDRRAMVDALAKEWKMGLLPFEVSPPPTNGGAEAGDGKREETGDGQRATGETQQAPGERQPETTPEAETKAAGDSSPQLRIPRSAFRVRTIHPFVFLAAGFLALVGLFVYARLTAVDRGRPEAVARAYVEAVFPDRRDLAVRRGSLYLDYFAPPEAPRVAPGTGAGETTLKVYLGGLAQLVLTEAALLSVRTDGNRAGVELLLVYSGGDRETFPVDLCDTASGWRVVVDPGRPRLFAWEGRVERELARLRQAVPALEKGYEP